MQNLTFGRQKPPRRFWRWLGAGLFALVWLCFAVLAVLALDIQLSGTVRTIALAALAIAMLAAGVLRYRRSRPAGWAMLLATITAMLVWYGTLTPRQDRDWAPEVAHSVSGTVNGDQVTLANVRNFNWSSETTASEHWETRRYGLSRLDSVDMFTSVWGNPNIAHLIVSFGFLGGDEVAFSVEIRKERDEEYSSLGGFFRQFEIALIAADEGDIVKLRTNYRGEDVSRFPVKLTPDQRRALFLSYVDFGNQLNADPQFYNTVTANCSSTVWRLAKVIKNDIPFDYRLLLSGRLPEMLEALGALPGDEPMAERRAAAHITDRAKALPQGADYSDWIRQQ